MVFLLSDHGLMEILVCLDHEVFFVLRYKSLCVCVPVYFIGIPFFLPWMLS